MPDAYADGDYGTSWDMRTRQAKAEVSRADYVRRHKLCRPFFEGQGVRWKVLEVTVFGDWAVVRASRETSVAAGRSGAAPEIVDWAGRHVAALEVEGIGPAGHQAPEDRPDAIGRAISRWLDRHRLTCLTREAASAK